MTMDIGFERHGRLGVVILDRQQALNALTHAMVRALSAQLADWREDSGIGAVLVKPAPGRAFCAGGDIVAVAELVARGGVMAAVPLFITNIVASALEPKLTEPYSMEDPTPAK